MKTYLVGNIESYKDGKQFIGHDINQTLEEVVELCWNDIEEGFRVYEVNHEPRKITDVTKLVLEKAKEHMAEVKKRFDEEADKHIHEVEEDRLSETHKKQAYLLFKKHVVKEPIVLKSPIALDTIEKEINRNCENRV